MKVLTKCVIIEDQKFYLVEDQHEGRRYWGTIPYSFVGADGRMIKPINGVQMRMSFEGAGEALENRRRDVVMGRLIDGFKAQGMDLYEAMEAMTKCEEYQQLYK
jgi:hypothetical protein